ncbi:MAG TPA: dethiobiotin synthase [Desulfuromonadaceae bacterium]|nr:dethiobiotin synthase [Desulfuromonadaceae bacterium]
MKPIYFITGTNTGAGKTVLAALCVRALRRRHINATGLKPICSGGRDDARALAAAGDGALSINEVNPWHFRPPIAPLLAARTEKQTILLSDVVAHISAVRRQFDVVVVEGAGGLLSPLGKNFDSRDLLLALRAQPIIVAPNTLGAINHLLLTVEALPKKYQVMAKLVLVAPPKPDAATGSNPGLLAEFFDRRRIFQLPHFSNPFSPLPLKTKSVTETLRRLLA